MRAILIGLLAVAGIAIATPASAQGFYFGAPGIGIGVGSGHHGYEGPRYRSYDYDSPRYQTYGHRNYDDSYARSECRTITIRRDDGSVRRIRRCD
jgi:hypothetical protein